MHGGGYEVSAVEVSRFQVLTTQRDLWRVEAHLFVRSARRRGFRSSWVCSIATAVGAAAPDRLIVRSHAKAEARRKPRRGGSTNNTSSCPPFSCLMCARGTTRNAFAMRRPPETETEARPRTRGRPAMENCCVKGSGWVVCNKETIRPE